MEKMCPTSWKLCRKIYKLCNFTNIKGYLLYIFNFLKKKIYGILDIKWTSYIKLCSLMNIRFTGKMLKITIPKSSNENINNNTIVKNI